MVVAGALSPAPLTAPLILLSKPIQHSTRCLIAITNVAKLAVIVTEDSEFSRTAGEM